MKDTWLSILRHVLTAAGAAAVHRGYINDSGATEIVGAIVTLAGAVWGALDEYVAAKNKPAFTRPNYLSGPMEATGLPASGNSLPPTTIS